MPELFETPLTDLQGQSLTLNAFKGKVLLVVNVASKCGFTPQYTGLEELYRQYKDRGFSILGFPANDFAGQEPGTDAEIASFCSTEYPVSFPVFSKIVVAGPAKHPLYAELTAVAPPRVAHTDELQTHLSEYATEHGFPAPNAPPEVLWNFEKFVIDRGGKVIARFNPDVRPDDPELLATLEAALG